MKIALGTVQFGLPYGVANQKGQVAESEVNKILEYAKECNIDLLDTAIGYGDSEQCLGNVGVNNWKIITKLPGIPQECININAWINDEFIESLKRLNVNRIKGLMLHRPMQLLDPIGKEIWSILQELKKCKLVEQVGFSIYEPKELEQLYTLFKPDIIQAPFNILDQRLKTSGWLEKLHNEGVEVHIRSIFLQGLLLIKKEDLPEKFNRWSSLWEAWDNWLTKEKLSPLEASISFVNLEPLIDYAVVGVDSLQQLEQIINISTKASCCPPKELIVTDQNLINPSNWKKL